MQREKEPTLGGQEASLGTTKHWPARAVSGEDARSGMRARESEWERGELGRYWMKR